MVILVQKLGRSLRFPSKLENCHQNSEALSASFRNFRSKISSFINQNLFKPNPGSENLSLTWLIKCFELIHISNRAFAKMIAEIDYPMSKWGAKATEEYLNYTLNLLDLLNSINSSISHLNQVKVSIFHALKNPIKNSPSAGNYLQKIPSGKLGKDFKEKNSTGVEELKPGTEMEFVILQALMVLKKNGFLAFGFVLSGLCSDAKPYMEVRESVGGVSDDPSTKSLDEKFRRRIMVVEEVKEVNCAVEGISMALSNGRCDEAVKELKRKLEVMENSINAIEKEADNLFSEVFTTRNKLIDSLRISGKSP